MTSSDSSVVTITGSVPFLVEPEQLGSASIAIAVGNMNASVPIDVSGSAAVSAIDLREPRFVDTDVPDVDPSHALCSKTFRGHVGDPAPLTARFKWQDELCWSPETNLCEVPALVATLTSSEVAAIAPSAGCSLTLQGSSTFDVDVTAGVDPVCTADGATLTDTITLFSNLEANPYEFDLGHRCGAAFAVLDDGVLRPVRPAAAAEAPATFYVPVSLNVPSGGEVLSLTTAHTFNNTVLEAVGVHSQGCGCADVPAFYDANTGLSGSNFGDTNAVRVNTVWRSGDGALDGVRVVHTLCFKVRDAALVALPGTQMPGFVAPKLCEFDLCSAHL